MDRPIRAYVALGANLGDASAAVRLAFEALRRLPKSRLVGRSSLYRSAPHEADGPDFINAVAALDTALDPHALLAALQSIENDAGRQRPFRHAPRTLDLDLLMHGEAVIDSATLTLPHPRMNERAFVLVPLAELAPALVAPAALDGVASQRIERIAGRA